MAGKVVYSGGVAAADIRQQQQYCAMMGGGRGGKKQRPVDKKRVQKMYHNVNQNDRRHRQPRKSFFQPLVPPMTFMPRTNEPVPLLSPFEVKAKRASCNDNATLIVGPTGRVDVLAPARTCVGGDGGGGGTTHDCVTARSSASTSCEPRGPGTTNASTTGTMSAASATKRKSSSSSSSSGSIGAPRDGGTTTLQPTSTVKGTTKDQPSLSSSSSGSCRDGDGTTRHKSSSSPSSSCLSSTAAESKHRPVVPGGPIVHSEVMTAQTKLSTTSCSGSTAAGACAGADKPCECSRTLGATSATCASDATCASGTSATSSGSTSCDACCPRGRRKKGPMTGATLALVCGGGWLWFQRMLGAYNCNAAFNNILAFQGQKTPPCPCAITEATGVFSVGTIPYVLHPFQFLPWSVFYDPQTQTISVHDTCDQTLDPLEFLIDVVGCNQIVIKTTLPNSTVESALVLNYNNGSPVLQFVPITGAESQYAWTMTTSTGAVYDPHVGACSDIEFTTFTLSFDTGSGVYYWVLQQATSQTTISAFVLESELCQAGIVFPLWILEPLVPVCRLQPLEKLFFKSPCTPCAPCAPCGGCGGGGCGQCQNGGGAAGLLGQAAGALGLLRALGGAKDGGGGGGAGAASLGSLSSLLAGGGVGGAGGSSGGLGGLVGALSSVLTATAAGTGAGAGAGGGLTARSLLSLLPAGLC